MACCGDVPTLETLAAVSMLREHLPELRVRVVNVVDLMRLQPDSEHPHGLPDAEFDALFTVDRPVDLRLSRLSLADPPPDLPPRQPRQPARPRLQGGGHDHDAVRHGHAQRPRPLSPRDGRDRPRARAWPSSPRSCARTWKDERLKVARLYPRPRRGPTRRLAAGPGRAERLTSVLVVNAGSTSLKLSDGRRGRAQPATGLAERGAGRCRGGRPSRRPRRPALPEPVLLDAPTLAELHALRDLAPLHNAPALDAIGQAQRALPALPQVAVFDTEFHASMPDEAPPTRCPRAGGATARSPLRLPRPLARSGPASRCASSGWSSAISAAVAR